MKTVYFVTNAKSEKVTSKKTDYACRITEKGKSETLSLLKTFTGDKDFKCDRIITSVALRAFDTASLIAGRTGFKKEEIIINEYLYQNCSFDTVKKMFDAMDNSTTSVIVVGHSSSLSETVNKLFPEFTMKMPESAAVCVNFNTDTWSEIFNAVPSLKFYHFIKNSDLTKIDKMAKKDIIVRSETELNNLVKKIGEEIAFSDSKSVKKQSRNFFNNIVKQAKVVTITDIQELKNVKSEIENNEKLKEEKRLEKIQKKENELKFKLEKKIEAKKAKAVLEKEKLEKKKNKIEKKVETKNMKLDKLSGKVESKGGSASVKKNNVDQNLIFKKNANNTEVSAAITSERMIATKDEPDLPESNE